MSSMTLHLMFRLVEGYLSLGLVFAAWFLTKGVGRMDPAAKEAKWWVRLLWLPGVMVLWPQLLRRFQP
jgi:hypothetical protein